MYVKNIIKRLYRGLNNWASGTAWFENTADFAGCKRIAGNSRFDLDLVNLGSSSGYYALNYEEIGVDGLNLATPKQSLWEDYEMIRNYFSYLREGAVVLIPLCLFTALEGEETVFPDKYYILFQSESIPNYSWKRKLQVLNIYNNPIKYIPAYSFIREFCRPFKRRVKSMSPSQLANDASKWIEDWKKEFSIIDFNRPLSLRNQDSYTSASEILNRIVQFCYGRRLRPVVVLPPVSKSLSSLYDDTMRKLLITDFVNKSVSGGTPFLNYLDDEQFIDDSLFRNAFILNEKGASEFTQRVLSDLKAIKYI